MLISNLDAAAVTFRKKRAATDTFARSQQLPPEMSTRLRRGARKCCAFSAVHCLPIGFLLPSESII